jgi:hypothetical protein
MSMALENTAGMYPVCVDEDDNKTLSLSLSLLSLSPIYIDIDLLPSQIFGPSKFDFPPEKKRKEKRR